MKNEHTQDFGKDAKKGDPVQRFYHHAGIDGKTHAVQRVVVYESQPNRFLISLMTIHIEYITKNGQPHE